MTSSIIARNLIFFVHPDPKGSEENQFTPLGDGVNKLIFERYERIKNFRYKFAPLKVTIKKTH
jgi:hypothetical protein